MNSIETLCHDHMTQLCALHPDPSHDISHVERVVRWAKSLAEKQGANLDIVVPAAYLHDCVYISKSDARRSQASKLSADFSLELLKKWNYSEKYFPQIHHAILAHSFSANVPTESLEAQVVQDADRLDAMGVIGSLRCFAFSGMAGRALYSSVDPFAQNRVPNDATNTLDHFYVKLLKLQDKLHTQAAKTEGARRVKSMQFMLQALETEI